MGANDKHICCICGKEFIGWGNNPYPVVEDEDARCCDECNAMHVIPARLLNLRKHGNKGEG